MEGYINSAFSSSQPGLARLWGRNKPEQNKVCFSFIKSKPNSKLRGTFFYIAFHFNTPKP
jgi:hypothetical protein